MGAINSAFLASMAHDPATQGSRLVQLWRDLRNKNIYRRGPVSVGKLFARSALGIGSHIVGLKGFAEPDDDALQFRGIFDTTPFFQLLRQKCNWQEITKNIENGVIDAVAIAATNMLSGEGEIFLQKRDDVEYQSKMVTHLVKKITPRHVMASAALPLLFPAVPIQSVYYNDGGLRLTTPLAPAVALHAKHILIIGTRWQPTAETREELDTQAKIAPPPQPSLNEILGKVYNAIFLDRLENDLDHLNRINKILENCKELVSPEIYEAICKKSKVQEIKTISIFPSENISSLVDETLGGSFAKMKTMGSFERFVLRVLEADPGRGNDLLSYFLFEPEYLEKLIDMGFEDARKHHDQLAEFAENAIKAAE